ncbi:hypothetical protein HDU77_011201 [Chytriomyces hyalinus]|nr:hypothetical protein HDU77_011201 [Chytriomyces hyalinus]
MFPLPEKVSLFNNLKSLPQEPESENTPSMKAALPGINAFTVPHNVGSKGTETPMQHVTLDHGFKTVAENQTESSSHQMALPDNPRDWNQDETAQWILERFGDAKLSSLALSQKINGRALLMLERNDMVSALKLETVGERILFAEAVAELKRQSEQQSALAQEDPPSYE